LQDGGVWCACGPLTPYDSCGSCLDINGSDPSYVCYQGLACGYGELACIASDGSYGMCYGEWANCNCNHNTGIAVCSQDAVQAQQ